MVSATRCVFCQVITGNCHGLVLHKHNDDCPMRSYKQC
jgi:hypothetical protein